MGQANVFLKPIILHRGHQGGNYEESIVHRIGSYCNDWMRHQWRHNPKQNHDRWRAVYVGEPKTSVEKALGAPR